LIEEQIPAALAGERLDRLVSLITECSRADAAALVLAGGASVDGEVSTSGKQRVRAGQVVQIDIEMLPAAELPQPDAGVAFSVLYDDQQVIVVDKPAGLVVHPGAGNPAGTLVNGLLARYPELVDVGEAHRPGIVHRLDAGTSGLMVAARTQDAYERLVEMLAAHDVGRIYRALVWGHVDNTVGVIDAPIGRDHRDPLRMAVVVDGKPARTRFRVLATHRTPSPTSSLECRLETGRTHQIRVHFAAIGHPVVGDAPYGGVRVALDCPRPFLHAARLELCHPRTGQEMQFESALPADLLAVESLLGDGGTGIEAEG